MQIPVPASTVVLVRPAAVGFEVFLVRRHDNVAFMGGAHVFPGGRVDAADHPGDDARWHDGAERAAARTPRRGRDEAVALHVAAVRELFEEAGVLLARAGDRPVAISTSDESRFAAYRHQLTRRETTIAAVATREGLRLALDALMLFANWVTPEIELKRFDTHFFLAVAPDAQTAAHDDHETTHGEWMAPGAALDRCLRGDIALPPPTWTTLRALSRCDDVDAAWRWASAQAVPRIQPCFREQENGTRLVMLPGDPLCPPVEGFASEETRFLLQGGRWKPVSSV